MFFFNPFWPLTALRIASLKATSTLLLFLLIKSNLLRLKGGLLGGIVALTLISGLIVSTTIAGGSAYFILRNNKSYSDDKNEDPEASLVQNLVHKDDSFLKEIVLPYFSQEICGLPDITAQHGRTRGLRGICFF